MNFSLPKYFQFLNNNQTGKNIYYINKTISTNLAIWDYYKDDDYLLLISDIQTNGRGRRGNKWFSVPYNSLTFSIAMLDDKKNSSLIALKVGIAISNAINKTLNIDVKTKWPNDIIINNRKVGGILIESSTRNNKKVLCIGVGINVNIEKNKISDELKNHMTSLLIETNKITSKEELLAKINTELDSLIYKDAKFVIQKWTELCGHLHSNVKFHNEHNELINGEFVKVDECGNAIINHNGKIQSYSSGVLY